MSNCHDIEFVIQQFKIDCSFNSNLNGIKTTLKFSQSPSTTRILDSDADKKSVLLETLRR